MVPVTDLGKIFAALIAIWGIIVIALPVGFIGSNFVSVYSEEKQKSLIVEEYKKKLKN